jgi:hypothetical protein
MGEWKNWKILTVSELLAVSNMSQSLVRWITKLGFFPLGLDSLSSCMNSRADILIRYVLVVV